MPIAMVVDNAHIWMHHIDVKLFWFMLDIRHANNQELII